MASEVNWTDSHPYSKLGIAMFSQREEAKSTMSGPSLAMFRQAPLYLLEMRIALLRIDLEAWDGSKLASTPR